MRCNGGGGGWGGAPVDLGGFGDGPSLNNAGRDCRESLISAEVVILVSSNTSLVI